jgi:hypothetical protein
VGGRAERDPWSTIAPSPLWAAADEGQPVQSFATTHVGSDWPRAWILATLGRMDAARVRSALADDPLLAELEPLLSLGPTENWLASPEIAVDLRFLLLQEVPG